MRLGIISDTHDKFEAISTAVEIFKAQGCAAVLHAGDFCTPKAFELFQNNTFQLIYKIGNHDYGIPTSGDEIDALGDMKSIILHNTYERIYKNILLNVLVDSGIYDLIVYGHLHYINLRLPDSRNPTIAINPGGFYHDDLSTFCIYDTKQNQLEVYYKFNGSFVLTLIFQVPSVSYEPTICSSEAANAFFIAYALRSGQYIHSYQDTGEQWMSRSIWKIFTGK